MRNTLFFGDNLEVLRKDIPDASVDLIYLDPPFNSAANYNILFKSPDGRANEGSIEAFKDTWAWGDSAALAYEEVLTSQHNQTATMLRAMRGALGESDLMAYLAMMAIRLIELHRVLKPTGSLYLHCDPTASHYLKILMDAIFGQNNFRAEIIWKRTNARGTKEIWPRLHDVVLQYSKSKDFWFRSLAVAADSNKMPHTLISGADGQKFQTYELTGAGVTKEGESGKPWRGFDPAKFGRHWAQKHAQLDEWDRAGLIHWPKHGGFPRRKDDVPFEAANRMVVVGDVWNDIDRINQTAKERLGYPTQKPLALLERIIAASSNPGDVVLDPFCGCGTAVHAAEKLGRRWIGIDITHLSISLIERRLKDAFPAIAFDVQGTPKDLAGAQNLADRDKHQFQWWAVSLVDAVPQDGQKKGADRGIDGIRWVRTGPNRGDLGQMIVSVKGGQNISVRDVRDLAGTVEREKAAGGILITMARPTRDMLREAASHGFFDYGLGKTRKIVVKTIEELLAGISDEAERLPPIGRNEGFRAAPRERKPTPTQGGLDV